MTSRENRQGEQEDEGGGKGRPPQSSRGFAGPGGRELRRRASKAKAAKAKVKAGGVREKAEAAFGGALGKMVTELGRLWRQKQGFRRGTPGAKPLEDGEEYRLWWLADKIVVATKGVIPISATVDSRVDIPIIPVGMVELLRGIVPGREAMGELGEGEVVDVPHRALEAPAPLAPGQTETRKERSERNKWEWRQQQQAKARDTREKRKRAQAGDTPTPPPADAPAPPASGPQPSRGEGADPTPPTRPASDPRDP